ncbi:MAG TPA: hypothetical protein PLE92_08380, partial [Lentisphaeria bacterium]|nr:hypothetical protein [Lentisphaeria bacterium]
PLLHFEVDKQFKKTLATLQLIDQAMDEIRRKERENSAAGADQPPACLPGAQTEHRRFSGRLHPPA